ncbi:MAG: hypothetical protein KH178_11990 [Roseburia sp.]|nr:hypothetical protein [Roseburia sp.]
MKPFIGFDTGAGASLSVVHWAVAADEAVAGVCVECTRAAASFALGDNKVGR